MGERERVELVTHHALKFIPELASEGEISAKDVFLRFGTASLDYPFLWEGEERIVEFTTRINEAIVAYNIGEVVEIPEERKSEDHICQVCGNLIEGKCRLEKYSAC